MYIVMLTHSFYRKGAVQRHDGITSSRPLNTANGTCLSATAKGFRIE